MPDSVLSGAFSIVRRLRCAVSWSYNIRALAQLIEEVRGRLVIWSLSFRTHHCYCHDQNQLCVVKPILTLTVFVQTISRKERKSNNVSNLGVFSDTLLCTMKHFFSCSTNITSSILAELKLYRCEICKICCRHKAYSTISVESITK